MAVALVIAALLMQQPQDAAAGQETQQTQPSTQLEEIVVDGRAIDDAAREFVEEVGVTPRGARLARWEDRVCVSVIGLRAPVARMMIDRIAVLTEDLGLEAGEPGCQPNVVILATDDARGAANSWVSRERGRFRMGLGNSDLGLASLQRFRTTDAPVRWWHTSVPVFVDSGQMAVRYRGGTPPGADAMARGGSASETGVRNPSRMKSGVRHDLNSVSVIIDMVQVEGVSLPALVDYTAMLALAQVDPRADFSGQSTVMNLFADPEGVTGLTQWDQDYLRALYAARPDRATAYAQEAEVASGIVRERTRTPDAEGQAVE
jgi:hypothetical protein